MRVHTETRASPPAALQLFLRPFVLTGLSGQDPVDYMS